MTHHSEQHTILALLARLGWCPRFDTARNLLLSLPPHASPFEDDSDDEQALWSMGMELYAGVSVHWEFDWSCHRTCSFRPRLRYPHQWQGALYWFGRRCQIPSDIGGDPELYVVGETEPCCMCDHEDCVAEVRAVTLADIKRLQA